MTTQLTRLPNTATAREVFEITQRDGGCIVEQHIDPVLLAKLNSELDVLLDTRKPNQGIVDNDLADFLGHRTKRLSNLPLISDTFSDIAINERLLDWVKLSLSWGSDFLLNAAQVIEIGPGEPAQFLHRDEILWSDLAALTDKELLVSCMHALTDFDEELGATRVIPGTNQHPKKSADSFNVEQDSVAASMKAGDALFFTGSVVHGGGANKSTTRTRRGMSVTYSLGWLRPEEAYNLSVPLARVKQLPPRMRELLGFASYRAPAGFSYQFDMKDPYVTLFGEDRPTPPPTAGSFGGM